MKQSFSLLETIISVLLLSIVISALLQTKNNNLYILSSITKKDGFDELIAIHSVSNLNKEQKINFRNLISLNNDDVRKKLKNEKIKLDTNLDDNIEIKTKKLKLKLNITEELYSSDKYGQKRFYRIKIDE